MVFRNRCLDSGKEGRKRCKLVQPERGAKKQMSRGGEEMERGERTREKGSAKKTGRGIEMRRCKGSQTGSSRNSERVGKSARREDHPLAKKMEVGRRACV